jgi:sugar/nucleoside kinase (ribokinase family)
MQNGIAFAGSLIVDRIKFVDSWPDLGALTTVRREERSLGGLASNCTQDMAKIAPDVPVKVLGMVGEDDLGDYVLENFAPYANVDTSLVERKGSTAYTDVMTIPDGARTFFTYQGSNALVTPEYFDFTKMKTGLLHIGYIMLMDGLDAPDDEYGTKMCRVLKAARDAGVKVSIDVVTEQSGRYETLVKPALKYADYCILNEVEAGFTTGVTLRDGDNLIEENFEKCVRELASLGVSKWVVVHSPELSAGYDVETGEYFCEPSWEIPKGFKVSSVGAGDAFATAVLLSAYREEDISTAVHKGGAVAAYSLSGVGASDSLKPLEEIIKEMEAWQ